VEFTAYEGEMTTEVALTSLRYMTHLQYATRAQ